MSNERFIPHDFHPPERIALHSCILRKPDAYRDTDDDYHAIMASIDIIHQIRGGSWPTKELTKEEDFLDLAWHQREFEYETSFAYLLYSPDNTTYLGCLYIYPTNKPWVSAPTNTDAVVNMWVTQDAYDKNLYPVLFKEAQQWISDLWPFKHIFYSNKEIPQ